MRYWAEPFNGIFLSNKKKHIHYTLNIAFWSVKSEENEQFHSIMPLHLLVEQLFVTLRTHVEHIILTSLSIFPTFTIAQKIPSIHALNLSLSYTHTNKKRARERENNGTNSFKCQQIKPSIFRLLSLHMNTSIHIHTCKQHTNTNTGKKFSVLRTVKLLEYFGIMK